MLLVFIIHHYSAQSINLGNHWYTNGPNTANVTAMEMAPSNANVLYLGTYSGVIYKSINKAQTWNLCSTEGLLDFESFPYGNNDGPSVWGDYHIPRKIVINPADENEIYVLYGSRMALRSFNGGDSWEVYNFEFGDTTLIRDINIDPRDPNKRLISLISNNTTTSTGVYQTMDGGETWNIIDSLPQTSNDILHNIVRNPYFPDRIYITYDFHLYKSINNGETWEGGLLSSTYLYTNIYFDPDNELNMWAVDNTVFFETYLSKSEDGGETWNYITHDTSYYYDWLSLFMDQDKKMYIENRENIYKSTDLGYSFDIIPYFENKDFSYLYSLYFSYNTFTDPSNADEIFFGNLYGVHTSLDGANTIEPSNSGLNNSYIEDIEMAEENTDILYAGGIQGLWKTTDAGQHWERLTMSEIDWVKSMGKNGDTLFAYEYNKFILRSFDGGETFDTIYDFSKLGIDKENLILYGYTFNELYKSYNLGETWELLIDFNSNSFPYGTEIIVDEINPNNVYFGSHRSTDGGETWNLYFFDFNVKAVDPKHSQIIYANNNQGDQVYQSTNYGITFTKIYDTDTLSYYSQKIKDLKVDPQDSSRIYIGTIMDGIIYSQDFGQTWQKLNGDFNSRAYEIIPVSNEHKYYVATFGEGVWMYDTTYVGIENPFVSNSIQDELTVYPNPVKNTIHLQTNYTGIGRVSLYNTQGQLMKQTEMEFTENQSTEWEINNEQNLLNKGLYFISVEIGGARLYQKIIIE